MGQANIARLSLFFGAPVVSRIRSSKTAIVVRVIQANVASAMWSKPISDRS